MSNRRITTAWSLMLVERLVSRNAGFFCISPGSRSTPLAIAIARHPLARWKLFVDERSAAFFALGYGRATGRPAVLVCTSGTAVANYLPGVVEASMDYVPMLLLTADRPFELQECGANQTIRQQGIFGSYVRWAFALPEPAPEVPMAAVLSAVDHALVRCCGDEAGPVHVNVPFREPFVPEPPVGGLAGGGGMAVVDGEPGDAGAVTMKPERAAGAQKVAAVAVAGRRVADAGSLGVLRELVAESVRPVLVAGSVADRQDREALAALAAALELPFYADIASGIRLHPAVLPWQLAMGTRAFVERYRADLVLHFGGGVVARQPGDAVRQWQPRHHVVVRPQIARLDPTHSVTWQLSASIASVAEALMEWRPGAGDGVMAAARGFFAAAGAVLDGEVTPELPVSELSVARMVTQLAGPGEALFVSNSMPVRDVDLCGCPGRAGAELLVGVNRGASGIDGILSTAAGLGYGVGRAATVVIGDIAFLHDLNALSLAASLEVPLRIVLVNNGGGGIFSFLPVAACHDVFETHFATPQHYNAAELAAGFGLSYARASTNGEFAGLYDRLVRSGRSGIIEVTGERHANVALHQRLRTRLDLLGDELLLF